MEGKAILIRPAYQSVLLLLLNVTVYVVNIVCREMHPKGFSFAPDERLRKPGHIELETLLAKKT